MVRGGSQRPSSPTAEPGLLKNPKLQGTNPKRKRRLGAAPFGNPNFIDSRISGPNLSEKRADGPSGHCARNISDMPTKHTKTNPQRPGECAWSPKPSRVGVGVKPTPLVKP